MIPLTKALVIAEILLRVLLSLHLLMRRRPVPVTLAWLFLLLIPVPWVGVIAYAIVGEVRLGARRVREYTRLTADYASRATIFWRGGSQDWTSDCAPYRQLGHVASHLGDMPPLRGNHISFLADAEHMIEALVRDIDAARERIHMLYYIWMEKNAGEVVVAALERAAARGVVCRVLVDAVGSKKFMRSVLAERLRRAGVRLAEALPVNPLRMLLARIDVRNHRKITVIDGWLAYTGSQNITDSTFGYLPLRKIGPWIDATLRVEGPAAEALEVVFLRDWEVETDERMVDQIERILPDRDIPEHGSIVQVVPTGPGMGQFSVRDALVTAFYSAREELIITTPYFVPDEPTKQALAAAVLRGVRVSLVVPERLNGPLVAAASNSHYDDLLEAGVRVYRYRNGLLHAKTVTIDSDVAMIGSANLDVRSFYLNYEVSVFVYDADQASVLRMLQRDYMQHSTELHADEWRRRPLLRRAVDNIARLFTPLL